MRTFWKLLALALSFTLVAAACGDDGDSDAGETGDGPADETDDGNADGPADETDDGNADETDADQTDETDGESPPDEPVDLTASMRGVTEDTITIGVAIPDVSQFSNSGAQIPRYQVVADAINDAGGLAGRQIELVTREWPLTESTGFDAACIELTEDIEVFAAVSYTHLTLPTNGCV